MKHNISLIGYGRWGKILLPYLEKKFNVLHIFGRSLKKEGRFTNDLSDTMGDDVDSVVVSTPIGCHYDIVKKALLLGKNVFCEKPLTIDTGLAEELIEIAETNTLALVTDYTYTFFEELRDMADKDIIRYVSVVIERGTDNPNSVYWLLLPHALSILNLFGNIEDMGFFAIRETDTYISIGGIGNFISQLSVNKKSSKPTTEVRVVNNYGSILLDGLHEYDNLSYAMEYFDNVINGTIDNTSNLECAYRVTKVINNLKSRRK